MKCFLSFQNMVAFIVDVPVTHAKVNECYLGVVTNHNVPRLKIVICPSRAVNGFQRLNQILRQKMNLLTVKIMYFQLLIKVALVLGHHVEARKHWFLVIYSEIFKDYETIVKNFGDSLGPSGWCHDIDGSNLVCHHGCFERNLDHIRSVLHLKDLAKATNSNTRADGMLAIYFYTFHRLEPLQSAVNFLVCFLVWSHYFNN